MSDLHAAAVEAADGALSHRHDSLCVHAAAIYCAPSRIIAALANDPKVREAMANVLVYHQATATSGCICGWAELGRSHCYHVAGVLLRELGGES